MANDNQATRTFLAIVLGGIVLALVIAAYFMYGNKGDTNVKVQLPPSEQQPAETAPPAETPPSAAAPSEEAPAAEDEEPTEEPAEPPAEEFDDSRRTAQRSACASELAAGNDERGGWRQARGKRRAPARGVPRLVRITQNALPTQTEHTWACAACLEPVAVF